MDETMTKKTLQLTTIYKRCLSHTTKSQIFVQHLTIYHTTKVTTPSENQNEEGKMYTLTGV